MSYSIRPPFVVIGAQLLALTISFTISVIFAQNPGPSSAKVEPKGDWLKLRPDGGPYQHEGTDLAWPQHLGDFDLRVGFRDKRSSAGITLSYVNEKRDIKGDIVIYPSSSPVPTDESVVELIRTELAKLVADTEPSAKTHGYNPLSTTPVEVKGIQLWKIGNIPLLVQEGTLVPVDPAKEQQTPSLSHWMGLVLYQDHFIHISVVMRLDKLKSDAAARDEFVKNILQCIREPAIMPEMLKLCTTYMANPFTDKNRAAADSLLTFTKESPILELAFPGEALTASLDEMKSKADGMELDLLRAYVVGASVVNLQQGNNEEMIEEGARVMCIVYDIMKEKQKAPTIAFLEELSAAAAKQGAAAFLKPRSAGGLKK